MLAHGLSEARQTAILPKNIAAISVHLSVDFPPKVRHLIATYVGVAMGIELRRDVQRRFPISDSVSQTGREFINSAEA